MQLFFDAKMKEGTSGMMETTMKYFLHPGLRIGWSLLQVVDPYVGPKAAAAILCALRTLKYIEFDPTFLDVELIVSNIDVAYEDTWKVSSITHAAPGISMRKYQKLIMNEYYNSPPRLVESIVRAYGLSNLSIVQELIVLAKGGLEKALRLHNKWPTDDNLKSYWEVFKDSPSSTRHSYREF